jgi:5S rRNA maturation endonuclease (ribonuclease M5)
MFIPQNLEELLDSLRDTYIVVEGKKDKKAFNSLGIFNVFDISGKSIESFIELLKKDKKYVILTDFDEEGEQKNKEIRNILEKNKFKINLKLRKIVKNSFGISKIEELIKFSKLKEDVYYGKISTIDYKIFNRSRFYRKWFSRKTRCDWSNIRTD